MPAQDHVEVPTEVLRELVSVTEAMVPVVEWADQCQAKNGSLPRRAELAIEDLKFSIARESN